MTVTQPVLPTLLAFAAPDTGISVERFLLLLAVILISAKILGELAERIGDRLLGNRHGRDVETRE